MSVVDPTDSSTSGVLGSSSAGGQPTPAWQGTASRPQPMQTSWLARYSAESMASWQ